MVIGDQTQQILPAGQQVMHGLISSVTGLNVIFWQSDAVFGNSKGTQAEKGIVLASFPGLLTPPVFDHLHCKRSKTGGVEGL